MLVARELQLTVMAAVVEAVLGRLAQTAQRLLVVMVVMVLIGRD